MSTPEHNPNIKQRPYRVVDYDPTWPELFKKYSEQVRQALGANLLEIHHFGSTSIPGMFAKPNIDIYALVKSLDGVRDSYDAMRSAGFTSRGDYSSIGEEYFTLDTAEGERVASIHVFEGSDEIFNNYRNFRDYLTENPQERDRYIELKKELYKKFKNDYPSYDAGKRHLIEELKAKANQWAETRNNS